MIMHVAYHLKRALSYFINGMVQNKCDSKTFMANKLGPLEHLFGNHKFCTEQCPGKKAYLAKEEYIPKTTRLDKKMHRDIYLDLLEVTDPYFQADRVQQILPDNLPIEVVLKGTQGCEAVNNADCTMAPKHQHFLSTCSLEDRSATMVATHNLGETVFYNAVARGIWR